MSICTGAVSTEKRLHVFRAWGALFLSLPGTCEEAEGIALVVEPGFTITPGTGGRAMVNRWDFRAGLTLEAALRVGWVRVVE